MCPTVWLPVHPSSHPDDGLRSQELHLTHLCSWHQCRDLGHRGRFIPGLWNKYEWLQAAVIPVLALIVTAGNGVAASVLLKPLASGTMSNPLMGLEQSGSDARASFTALWKQVSFVCFAYHYHALGSLILRRRCACRQFPGESLWDQALGDSRGNGTRQMEKTNHSAVATKDSVCPVETLSCGWPCGVDSDWWDPPRWLVLDEGCLRQGVKAWARHFSLAEDIPIKGHGWELPTPTAAGKPTSSVPEQGASVLSLCSMAWGSPRPLGEHTLSGWSSSPTEPCRLPVGLPILVQPFHLQNVLPPTPWPGLRGFLAQGWVRHVPFAGEERQTQKQAILPPGEDFRWSKLRRPWQHRKGRRLLEGGHIETEPGMTRNRQIPEKPTA